MQDITEDPKRQRQVPEEMDKLEKAVETMGSIVEETEGNLNSILKDPEPPENKEKSTVAPMAVPLAGHIREIRQRMTNQANRLGNILARLEL